MSFVVDPNIPWTEHFIQYGFAVLRNCVDRAYIDQALEQVRRHVEGEARTLPFDQWTTKNTTLATKVPGDPLLDAIYDQPPIRSIMSTMYGTGQVGAPTGWSGERAYGLFITPFDPDYKAVKLHGGHIDFGGNIIPIFGNAFVFQVCLRDTEPFGGNITIIPGSHKQVMKRAMDNPLTQYPYDFVDFPFVEPYEHVAKAGDVLLMHHLSFHSGNSCGERPHAALRLALHCQARRTTFLTKADPADADNCPWVKSFTLNGRWDDPNDQKRYEDFFCANKKNMWGYWTSDDGQMEFRVFTWVDGSLQAKVKVNGGAEERVVGARFDGQQLKFEFPGSGAGGSVLEITPDNPERMVGRLRIAAGLREVGLKRTKVITGRMRD